MGIVKEYLLGAKEDPRFNLNEGLTLSLSEIMNDKTLLNEKGNICRDKMQDLANSTGLRINEYSKHYEFKYHKHTDLYVDGPVKEMLLENKTTLKPGETRKIYLKVRDLKYDHTLLDKEGNICNRRMQKLASETGFHITKVDDLRFRFQCSKL